ncbi:schwannomin interacting protein 1 isoform X1 [Anticarsia gemmatalis]|uniref:schwannomin interacting protein 1 isoform X1 n=1 Tax=Anticarsia gemmatalis TaxID=129554 RepID=UPI003F773ACC
MRIKTENGNVAVYNRQDVISRRNPDNRSWLNSNNTESNIADNTTDYTQVTNCNTIYNSRRNSGTLENYTTGTEIVGETDPSILGTELVCNRQYRINSRNVNTVRSCDNPEKDNLEGTTETVHASCENFIGTTNVYADTTPIDEERAFEHSDTDEMSENGIHPVPRGIVNPNYPGFQHLAHTLQDYSSNIENFYHSENEMTDDDVDVEITDLAYEPEPNQNGTEYKNINNNNTVKKELIKSSLLSPRNKSYSQTKIVDSQIQNDIPDLIKTVSKNNNNNEDSFHYDINCTDADIENNFHTKDIIGDFNKEIEDEIKQLLNYNINIQDDLEELRKDIKDTFAKPIENTINNISDVVNHVIKKLVETQSDGADENEELKENLTEEQQVDQEINKINKENEKNTRTEMSLSRPTFLLIDNNTDGKITDAFLSDGKDEININEYDTEKLSLNVENTIKQLSTELRKIIPKLDEMRERDRLWAECKRDSIIIDGNSNEIANASKVYSLSNSHSQDKPDAVKTSKRNDNYISGKNYSANPQNDSKTTRNKQKEISPSKNSYRSAQNKTSVRKNDNAKDLDLGSFDVYNIETALPKLDLDAIENHLKAAKEAERRKRNDREEIRRRLAMGADAEEYYSMGHTDRPGKKPSLHSRLQSGMNLQICFMNETASDNESQASELEKNYNNAKSLSRSSIFSKSNYNHPYQTRPLSVNITKHDKISTVQSGAKLRPSSLTLKTTKSRSSHSLGHIEIKESDFYVLQATLQTEARIALAQAKEMARIQMERERRSRAVSPVTEMLQRSMEKANAPLAPDRRRVSRQLLTDMNIAQLQVIVNELHSQIESLNDTLVKLLMARDELHMGQDSMLVDIEDLTRYLGVKEQTKKTKGTTNKTGMKRLTSLVHK